MRLPHYMVQCYFTSAGTFLSEKLIVWVCVLDCVKRDRRCLRLSLLSAPGIFGRTCHARNKHAHAMPSWWLHCTQHTNTYLVTVRLGASYLVKTLNTLIVNNLQLTTFILLSKTLLKYGCILFN